MGADRTARVVRARAPAKINLTLRVLGVRADGYHALRTTFQTLALHDTLTFRFEPGPFGLACTGAACPAGPAESRVARDRTDLGRRREGAARRAACASASPSASRCRRAWAAAAATRPQRCACWRRRGARGSRPNACTRWPRALGADVPFFLRGGTSLGLERGDLLFPLADLPAAWVTIVIPPFGVSTVDAYGWFDASAPAPPGSAFALAAGGAALVRIHRTISRRPSSPTTLKSGGSCGRSGGPVPSTRRCRAAGRRCSACSAAGGPPPPPPEGSRGAGGRSW